jgi:predicted PurR-regulated permease PerM
MNHEKLELTSFVLFFAAVVLLTYFVYQPFIPILILATVLSVLLQPLYKKIQNLMKERNVSALIVVLLVLLFIIIPLLFLGFQIFHDAQNFFIMSQNGQSMEMLKVQTALERPIQHFFPTFSFAISDYTTKLFSFISANFAGLISQTAYILFQTFFLLFAFFFFLRDGENMLASIIALSPFEKEHTTEIVRSMHKTINSVIRGTLFVSIIRWLLLILAFYSFGISDAILWGSLAGIVGAIPGLGTLFGFAPAVAYLFLTGHVPSAIGLAGAGILIIFFIDNLLTTYFFGKGLDASPIFVLLSLLGGIIVFGPLGFIFGPLILSLFIAVIEMYKIILLKN